MAQELQPRAAFSVSVTEAEYVAAARVAARLSGGLLARRVSKAAAARDYAVFAALLSPATVTLWEDSMEIAGEAFTRRDPYALLPLLAETPALFVFLREDGTFAVLPKRAMPVDGGRVAEFLRGTFSRKYRRVR